MGKKIVIDKEKWMQNTACLFSQVFSVDYKDEVFLNKILSGGGGNSTLCSTWMHLVEYFIPYRISKTAFISLKEKLADEDKCALRLDEASKTVFMSKYICKKYHSMFHNNKKGAKDRNEVGKYFHYDHNPSNKKVLSLLFNKVNSEKDNKDFLKDFTDYVKNVQTLDLITIDEDDIRTGAERKNKKGGPLSASERDNLLRTEFYKLVIEEIKPTKTKK